LKNGAKAYLIEEQKKAQRKQKIEVRARSKFGFGTQINIAAAEAREILFIYVWLSNIFSRHLAV
jgi:hypothetical protein